MRIVAGMWGGRRICAPSGTTTRPTADKVREAIFSILGDAVVDASVLDLFAGSGALGLEALSRGASSAVFVDSDRAVCATLRRNIETLGAVSTTVIPSDERRAVDSMARKGMRFDLVFLDPPYEKKLAADAAGRLSSKGLLRSGTLVVVEEAVRAEAGCFPVGWETIVDRSYGTTRVTVFRVPEGEAAVESKEP